MGAGERKPSESAINLLIRFAPSLNLTEADADFAGNKVSGDFFPNELRWLVGEPHGQMEGKFPLSLPWPLPLRS